MSKIHRQDSQDFLRIFLNDTPLLDVRAPVEFSQGAFPHSINIPLLDDKQRELIGVRYKEQGQDEAIKLGLEMATPEVRQQRLSQWSDYCQSHPEGYLYCFRGGLRSKTTQQWLQQSGIDYPLIEGGYKAMRRFLLDQFEQILEQKQLPLALLAGATGSGKTRLLQKLRYTIDLEGLAQHRGSAFGRSLAAQPAQIAWENNLAIAFLKQLHLRSATVPLILEDEGRLIGRIYVPDQLQKVMKQSGLIVLQQDLASRVSLIREDYIDQQWPHYQQRFGDSAITEFTEFVLGNLSRIRKRLGGVRYEQVKKLFEQALSHLEQKNNSELFEPGIELLLTQYYDPMYHYLLDKRQGKILFSGNEDQVLAWAQQYQETDG